MWFRNELSSLAEVSLYIYYWNVTKFFRKWTRFKHVELSAGIWPCPPHHTHHVCALTLPTTYTHVNTQQTLINAHVEKFIHVYIKKVCRTIIVYASIDRPHWLLLIKRPVLLSIHLELCRHIRKEGNLCKYIDVHKHQYHSRQFRMEFGTT